jgi:AAA domain
MKASQVAAENGIDPKHFRAYLRKVGANGAAFEDLTQPAVDKLVMEYRVAEANGPVRRARDLSDLPDRGDDVGPLTTPEIGPERASDVQPEAVEWLWRDRVPKRMITVIAGRPDQGKGLLGAHMAAAVSRKGGKVLFSASEDSHSLITRPRLEAAGANLDNVLLWNFKLPRDQRQLESIVREEKIELIIVDPFSDHLSNGVSRHSDNVRRVVSPVSALIQETGTALVIIEHLLKKPPANGNLLAALPGSGSGLSAAARIAYMFGIDPADEDSRLLVAVKCNIAERPKAMRFQIDVKDVPVTGETPFLQYDTELYVDPRKLFENVAVREGGQPDKRAGAAEWLTNYLAAAGVPVSKNDIIEDARQQGMPSKVLRQAAEDMHVVKSRGGDGNAIMWSLPDEVKELLGIKKTGSAADIDTDGDDD